MRRSFTALLTAGAPTLGAWLLACQPARPFASRTPVPEPSEPAIEAVATQEVLTPVPVRVWLPSRYGADRVLVRYLTWGSERWETLELAREGQTWAGEISCRAISTVTGDTRYRVLALDRAGHTIQRDGWGGAPHVATIESRLETGPRSLRGAPPPARCHDPADCPPDLVGCPAYAWRRPPCAHDTDCRSTGSCEADGYCKDREDPVDASISSVP